MIKESNKISAIRSQRLAFPFYFISDTHLSTFPDIEQDKRIAKIISLLDEIKISKGTLFVLGDFFDFWFDKNAYVPDRLKPVISKIIQVIDEGIEIHFIAGNHDYWIKGYLTEEIGLKFYPNALQFDHEGKKYFLHHGDGAIIESKIYPIARKVMRSWWAIAMLKILPIKWIYKLGEKISHYNREHDEIPSAPQRFIDEMKTYLFTKNAQGYDLAISGHIHAPSVNNNKGKKAIILGDWIHHWTYGFMDEDGFELRKIF